MEDRERIHLTTNEYLKLLKFVGGNAALVVKLPKVKNKDIVIDGNLNINGAKISNLKGIVKVTGNLDISNTYIRDISHIDVGGYTLDYNTPLERARLAKIRANRIRELESFKFLNKFDLNENTELSNKVNALYEFFLEKNIINPDFEDEIFSLQENLEELTDRLNNVEEFGAIYTNLEEAINEIEDQIQELKSNNFGIYGIYPLNYSHTNDYYLVIEGEDSIAYDKTFVVLTDDECTVYAKESIESYAEEIELSIDQMQYYIDGEQVRNYFEYSIDEWVRDSPDSYLDEDDMENDSDQLEQIENLRIEASEIESKISELEDEDQIDDLNERLSEIEDEIEEIESDKSYPEHAIESYVSDWLDRIEEDPLDFLNEYGYNKELIKTFFDRDSWIDDVIRSDGEETHILHGEGSIGYVTINNIGYTIFYDEGGHL